MWICPACQAQNDRGFICKSCGYDDHTNFVKHLTAVAVPLSLRKGLHRQKDFHVVKKDIYSLQAAAATGDGDAAYVVGCCYYYGYGVRQNKDVVEHWWKKAWELKVAAYEKGAGGDPSWPMVRYYDMLYWKNYRKPREDPHVKQQLNETMATWQLSARKFGNVYAARRLAEDGGAWIFENQKGRWRSKEEVSLYWYKMAALLGDFGAAAYVGWRLLSKHKGEKERQEGLWWLSQAIDAKDPSAYMILAKYHMRQHQLAQSCYYFERAAEKNVPEAGQLLEILQMDENEVKTLESHARLFDDPVAKRRLALIYGYGIFGEKNEAKAVELITQAAKLGDREAMYMLGHCYDRGRFGIVRDRKAAVRWLEAAAAKGDVMAMSSLANLYQYTWSDVIGGLEKKKGFEMSRRAAVQDWCGEGQYRLARCYEHGDGTTADCEMASYWYKKSADNGYSEAVIKLKLFDFLGMIKAI